MPVVVYSFPGAKLVTARPAGSRAARVAVGLGAGPSPAATLSEYAVGTSTAIAGISSDVKAEMATTNPEVAFSVDALSTAIQAVTGASPGAPVAAQVAEVLGSVIVDLVSGKSVVSTAVMDALGAVEGFAEVVPFIGAIVGMFVDIVVASSAPKVSPQEQAALNDRYRQYCQDARGGAVRPTGALSLDPADLVSQGDARMRLLELLAGGAARDSLVVERYNRWHGAAKGRYGITGVPLHVQRQMVLLLEGIYSARRDPNSPLGSEIIGDNGRSLMPILLQVTVDQGSREARGLGQNAFNQDSLVSLANAFIAPGVQFCVKDTGGGAGVDCQDFPPCGDGVARSLWDMLKGWDTYVRDPTVRKAAGDFVMGQPKTSNLVLDAAMTSKLLGSVEKTQADGERFFRAEGFGIGQKLLSFAGAAGLGYAAFTVMRQWGPR